MAIVQTGSVQRFAPINSDVGIVATDIAVPADAEIVIVGWSDYCIVELQPNFNLGSMTFTKNGIDTPMTVVPGGETVNTQAAVMFYLTLPDTGANKTLKWEWPFAGSVGSPLCSLVFFKGIDTASPVRGTGAGQSVGLPVATGTISAAAGDLIVAFFAANLQNFAVEGSINSWSNLTLLSQLAHRSSSDGAWAMGSPSGDTTIAALTATNIIEGGIIAISLKPGSGGFHGRPYYDMISGGRGV